MTSVELAALAVLFVLVNGLLVSACLGVVLVARRYRRTLVHRRAFLSLAASLALVTASSLLETVYRFGYVETPLGSVLAWLLGVVSSALFLAASWLLARDYLLVENRGGYDSGWPDELDD